MFEIGLIYKIIKSNSEFVFFIKFENGAFHEFYVKFGALPNKGVLLARLTDDMSTIGITYNDGGYYATHVLQAAGGG